MFNIVVMLLLNMLGLLKPHTSGILLFFFNIWLQDNRISQVTGVMCQYEICLPVKHIPDIWCFNDGTLSKKSRNFNSV